MSMLFIHSVRLTPLVKAATCLEDTKDELRKRTFSLPVRFLVHFGRKRNLQMIHRVPLMAK